MSKVNFTLKEWGLVGLIVILNLPKTLVGLAYDPFGGFMMVVGSFIGAYAVVYVLKWIYLWNKKAGGDLVE